MNFNIRKDRVLSEGSEQCYANTHPERSCAKTRSSTRSYAKSGINSNLNKRLYNGLIPMVNNNEIECSIPGPNTVEKNKQPWPFKF